MTRNQRLTKQLQLSGKCLDFNWVRKQHEKGRLKINGSPCTVHIFEQLRTAIRATNEIYENQWDLEVAVSNSARNITIDIRGIIIRFPEVRMRNSQDGEHTVKELFVKIGLYKDGTRLKIDELQGGRMQQSYPEWSSNYFHSHLHSISIQSGMRAKPPYFSSFCTGSGHIVSLRADINGDGLNETRFTSFLIQIISLVSWESIEGIPYVYFRDVFNRSRRSGRQFSFNSRQATELKDKIIAQHKTNNTIPKITYEVSGDLYVIKDDAAFEEFLVSTPFTEEEKSRYLCMKDASGTYYKYGNVPGDVPPPVIRDKFIFKGEELSYQITEASDENRNIVYFVHPRIKEHILKELEYDTNIKKIRKSTLDRYSD